MFLHITQARYIRDYTLEVSFNDGSKGVADLAEALKGPVFEPLRDLAEFRRFRVDEGLATLVWPNGADLAPEYIFFRAFKDVPELAPRFKAWGYLD